MYEHGGGTCELRGYILLVAMGLEGHVVHDVFNPDVGPASLDTVERPVHEDFSRRVGQTASGQDGAEDGDGAAAGSIQDNGSGSLVHHEEWVHKGKGEARGMALSPKDHVGDVVVKFFNVTEEGGNGLA